VWSYIIIVILTITQQQSIPMPSLRVPYNVDMSQFENIRWDKERIAYILDYIYRGCEEGISSGDVEFEFSAKTPIHYETLRYVIRGEPKRILNRIARSPWNMEPEIAILETDGSFVPGTRSREYRLTEKYRVDPQCVSVTGIKVNEWFEKERKTALKSISKQPENMQPGYLAVIVNLKRLTLEITEEQLQEILQATRAELVEFELDTERQWLVDKMCVLREKIYGFEEKYPSWVHETVWEQANKLWDKLKPDSRPKQAIVKKERSIRQRCALIESKVRRVRDFVDGKPIDYEFPFSSIDEQGRLYHHLTNMPKCLRPFVRMDGHKCVSYDLGTSHCVFVCLAVQEYIKENKYTVAMARKQAAEIVRVVRKCTGNVMYGTNTFYSLRDRRANRAGNMDKAILDELKLFKKLLVKDFYQHAIDHINHGRRDYEKYDRDSFKREVFFKFLYGKNLEFYHNEMVNYFIELFPVIYTILWIEKGLTRIFKTYKKHLDKTFSVKEANDYVNRKIRTHANFSKRMMKDEATIFFQEIIPEIMQQSKKPFVSVHDCILFKDGKEDIKPTEIIKNAFRNHGIEVKVKRERWNINTFGLPHQKSNAKSTGKKDKQTVKNNQANNE